MREHGFEDSWIKQLVVGPLFKPKEPLGFAKNGEFLLLGDDNKILLYNTNSQEMKNLQCGRYPNWFASRQAMIYEESLVSFTGAEDFKTHV